MENKSLLVAAIDFGTTYSGYAFSLRHDFERDPLAVWTNTWTGGNLLSPKTPSCVLFKPNGDFHSFGFEAEDKYSDLSDDDAHHDWYYFLRFKMKLYQNKKLSRTFQLEDVKGKTMPALKVFSCAIRFLRDNMLKTCKKQVSELSERDIQWVLTIPAIWSDASKQFMREAAEEAGIAKSKLVLCLEPEAASVFCKYLKLDCDGYGQMHHFSKGTKYMVLDAGGGTIDITVHEVQADGSLKEIHMANGGDWGGTTVDAAFTHLLEDITGSNIFGRFCVNHASDVIEMLRDFEVKKRSLKLDDEEGKITFKIPVSLNEECKANDGQDLNSLLTEKGKFTGYVTVRGDKMRANNAIARYLFDFPSRKIIEHLQALMKHPSTKGITVMLMVGGFSDSTVLQQQVHEAFPKMKIIVPQEAGLAVLKGAVIFGHEPRMISKRISKLTYGLRLTPRFDPTIHFEAKRYLGNDGNFRCKDVFDSVVEIEESIEVGESHCAGIHKPSTPDQNKMAFFIYASTQKSPDYVTDIGCTLLGKLEIDIPDVSSGLDRRVDVRMTFSNTELEVTATSKATGDKVKAAYDFL